MLRRIPILLGKAIDWWERADFIAKAVVWLFGGTAVSGALNLLLLSGEPLFLRVLIWINLFFIVFFALYIPAKLRGIEQQKAKILSNQERHDAWLADWEAVIPIGFVKVERVPNIPDSRHSAIWLEIKNQSADKLTGLLAQLVRISPAPMTAPTVGGNGTPIRFPRNLGTKTKLEALRANGKPLGRNRFDLGPHEPKQIEISWLSFPCDLLGHVTHETGQDDFIFCDDELQFEVQISGVSRPKIATIRLWVTDKQTGEWDCELVREQ